MGAEALHSDEMSAGQLSHCEEQVAISQLVAWKRELWTQGMAHHNARRQKATKPSQEAAGHEQGRDACGVGQQGWLSSHTPSLGNTQASTF